MDRTDLVDTFDSGYLGIGLDVAGSNPDAFLVGCTGAAYFLLAFGVVVGA
jgi:hypothetical protein